MPDLDYQTPTTTPSPTVDASSPATSSSPQSLIGNQAIVDIIKAQNHATGPRQLDPTKNGIVYLGLNAYAHDEARHLNKLNKDGGAAAARPGAVQDQITQDGKTFDLTTAEGAASFVATLGLPDQRAVDVADFLLNAGEKARDELAQFIRILSQRVVDRLITL
jgi:hypothetical protein